MKRYLGLTILVIVLIGCEKPEESDVLDGVSFLNQPAQGIFLENIPWVEEYSFTEDSYIPNAYNIILSDVQPTLGSWGRRTLNNGRIITIYGVKNTGIYDKDHIRFHKNDSRGSMTSGYFARGAVDIISIDKLNGTILGRIHAWEWDNKSLIEINGNFTAKIE